MKIELAEIEAELSLQFENVRLKGHGFSSFLFATSGGRAVEISEDNGSFWLEFWEKSDDEDAAPVKEMSVVAAEQAVMETKRWLYPK